MNYYNEYDPKAAAWLRELIKAGLLPEGEVDERSIKDVDPWDLAGYTQCHFFCGIGGWPLALRLAGVPDDYPLWTGSCPCQDFSTAGKQRGIGAERDLWPEFFRLIKVCRPPVVLGEQVAAAIGHGWLDRVQRDLEGEGYACGGVVLGAFSVGAPHKRERLYWGGRLGNSAGHGRDARRTEPGRPVCAAGAGSLEHATGIGSGRGREDCAGKSAEVLGEGHASGGVADDNSQRFYRGPICVLGRESRQAGSETSWCGTDGSMADSSSSSKWNEGESEHAGEPPERSGCCGLNGLADSQSAGLQGRVGDAAKQAGWDGFVSGSGCAYSTVADCDSNGTLRPRPEEQEPDARRTTCHWADYISILCRDGKNRRIPASAESVLLGMADGLPSDLAGCDPRLGFPLEAQGVKNRAVMLKGLGNAICPQVAAEFIRAFMEDEE